MAEIRITREHGLGLEQARQLALRWAEVAEQKLAMECTYEQGDAADVVSFERPGASGQLAVEPGLFRLHAKLGLLLGIFRGRIEAEIVSNLDSLLAQEEPLQAFETGLAEHEARKAAKKKA
ncbi:MAG TPA: polyhydroxyalkanoic acid system family protein [Ramlibacter sp.]